MRPRGEQTMWRQLFQLDNTRRQTLQSQLRETLVAAVLDGRLALGTALPSSRELARQLSVSRNTVVLAYQHLTDEGFLLAEERRGYFINPKIFHGQVPRSTQAPAPTTQSINWSSRLQTPLQEQRQITKPRDWRRYPYPFIYGQLDPSLIPVNDWRESCRDVLSVQAMADWSRDHFDQDHPELIEQIRQRVLPRRGVFASSDEILVTLGAQNSLYLLAQLLIGPNDQVGIEEPGYADARNIFLGRGSTLKPLPVDASGVVTGAALSGCQYVYLTPSHQCPTTVTLSSQRRQELLDQAEREDIILIEDDYEAETNYLDTPTAALKSQDTKQRVIYVGSLSKSIAPGLRLGFMVAPSELIEEARQLRRLMFRHPPANNQRQVARFLALGHYDALLSRLAQHYQARWQVMGEQLERLMPHAAVPPSFGGTAFWVKGPENLRSTELAEQAAQEGVLIEPGDVYFLNQPAPENFFRLGFSSIPLERIRPGLERLAALMQA